MDLVSQVVAQIEKAENLLDKDTQRLNEAMQEREKENCRANALIQLFQDQRYMEDIKNGRVCQPPVFYEAWKNSIGKINQYLQGYNEFALPRNYQSYSDTVSSKISDHNKELMNILA